ncbi:hypothetical protein ACFE04_010388 [Oxalis oulophora]
MCAWADIPFDILMCICERLLDMKDVIFVSSVCKSWQPSFNVLSGKFKLPPHAPLLMLAEENKHVLSRIMNITHPSIEIRNMFVEKAVASADPWNSKVNDFNKECVIVTTYEIGLPAFVKLGDKVWTDVQIESRWYSDIVCYKGTFYVESTIDVFCLNIDGQQVPLATPIAAVPFCNKDCGHPIPYVTKSFDVFKLIKNKEISAKYEYMFEKVENLGHQALFLGDGASFSLPATSVNGCHGNCIYFTDDSTEYYVNTENGGGYDMGIYNLSNGIIDRHYKGQSLSYFCPPLWYI